MGEHGVLPESQPRQEKLVLDLKNVQDHAALLRLVDTADVFVESFRPGVVERLGIAYDALRERNARLVYCSISAFRRDGPLRERPAHDLAVEALSGVLSMTLGKDGKPTIGLPLADLTVALNGLSGILMALLARERTGKGDYVEVTMHDSTLAASAEHPWPHVRRNRQPVARHERTTVAPLSTACMRRPTAATSRSAARR